MFFAFLPSPPAPKLALLASGCFGVFCLSSMLWVGTFELRLSRTPDLNWLWRSSRDCLQA